MLPVLSASIAFSSCGPVLEVLAGGLLAEDLIATLRAQRGDLPVEILVGRRYPCVANFAHFISH